MAKDLRDAPGDLWHTACHESGHVLTSFIQECDIREWSVIPIEIAQRHNRRIRRTMKQLDASQMWGYVDQSDNQIPEENLELYLSGYAGEGLEDFFDKPVTSYEEVIDIFGEDSDEALAWKNTEAIHRQIGFEPTNRTTVKTINAAYEPILDLYGTAPFDDTIRTLAEYMLSNSREMSADINDRMKQYLAVRKITGDTITEMRRRFKALNLPGIVRAHAFAS